MARERWFHFSGGKIVLGSAQPTTHMVVESLGEKLTDARDGAVYRTTSSSNRIDLLGVAVDTIPL